MCITSFPSSLKQDPFDWDQYAEDLSQCVEAMIETAITEDNLNAAKAIQNLIGEKEGNLLDSLNDLDSSGSEITAIDDLISGIEANLGK